MQRFGRSEQRWRDRWGGWFLVATLLALAGAWGLGSFLGDRLGNRAAQGPVTQPGTTVTNPAPAQDAAALADLTGLPKPMTVYLLQAAAFKTQEAAQKEAQRLQAKGIPAAVTPAGEWYRVVIGAYGSKDAASAAQAGAEAAMGGKLQVLQRRVDLRAQPATRPQDPKAASAYDDGVRALNGFMHEAANFWDAHAYGQMPQADHLGAYANRVKQAMDQLRPYSADLAVSQFLAVAEKATQASAKLTALAGTAAAPATAPAGGGSANEPVQAAMAQFLGLLDSYRAWVEGK